MDYIAYVLQRGAALWQEQEKRLRQSAQAVFDGADARQERDGTSEARQRLAKKLFSVREELPAEETVDAEAAAPYEGLRMRGTYEGLTDAQSGRRSAAEDGARWLSGLLSRGSAEGIGSTRVQERVSEFATPRDTAGLQVLSQSMERDARRYDGGFLLY